MGESWVILLAWGAVYSAGDLPPGVQERPGFDLAVRAIAVREEWIVQGQDCTLCSARAARFDCEGMPPLWIFAVLPSRNWISEQRRFAQGHLDWLDDQIALTPPGGRRNDLEDWREEAARLDRLYEWVASAQLQISDPPAVVAARQALGHVRDMIGRDAPERGALPPVVPLWRFRRVR